MIDSNSKHPPTLLRGARLVLPDGVVEAHDLLIEGGRIARIIPAGEDVPHAETFALDARTTI